MIRDWRTTLFKPNLLFVNEASAVFIDKRMDCRQNFPTPSSFKSFLEKSDDSIYPLRIFLDVVDHGYCTELFPESWRSKVWSPQQCPAPLSSGGQEHLEFQRETGSSIHGLKVEISNSIRKWISVLQEMHAPVEGIYSLPYEICRTFKYPQLMVLPATGQETRLIFSDGFNKFFYRILQSTRQELLSQEIKRTLKYICREFHVSLQDITVLSMMDVPEIRSGIQKWQQLYMGEQGPEAFLVSYLEMRGRNFQRKYLSCLKKAWRNYCLPRAASAVLLVASLILGVTSIYIYKGNAGYKKQLVELYQNTQNLQAKLSSAGELPELEKDFLQLQQKLKGYLELKQGRLDVLGILQKIKPARFKPLQITHVVLQRRSEEDKPHIRMFLEGEVKDATLPMAQQDALVKEYIHFLKAGLKDGTVRLDSMDHQENDMNRDPDDGLTRFTIQLDGRQP